IQACDTLLFRDSGLHGGVQRLIVSELRPFFPLHHVAACTIRHTLFLHQNAGACNIIQQRHVLTSTGCLCAAPAVSCAGLGWHTASPPPVSSRGPTVRKTRPASPPQAIWSWSPWNSCTRRSSPTCTARRPR